VDIENRGDRATAASTGSWLLRAGSGGLHGEGVCLDIADVVRDTPTILLKKIEDLRGVGANAPVDRVLRNAGGLMDVEPLKDADADGVLLVAQSDHGIDECRAARGEISGDDSDEAENHRATDERDPIGRC
jgi:hypothetical protein